MPVDLVDGFVLSASQLYLTTNYRAHALAQMEVLRRAAAYRNRQYAVPNSLQISIPAFSQVEQQISLQAGAYVWGLTWSAPYNETGNSTEGNYIYIQITDACTETPFFSDYVKGNQLKAVAASTANQVVRNPVLLAQPRLVGEPGTLDVEIYNSFSSAIRSQLIVLTAEPSIPPDRIEQYFERLRLEGLL